MRIDRMGECLGDRPWSEIQKRALTESGGFERLIEALLAKARAIEPEMKIWAHLDADGALRSARQADAHLAKGSASGPLFGMPVGIKDIIDTQGLPTQCGVPGWSTIAAAHDAPLVARFRAAGAIILGKTVTTPCAWLDPPPTRNPWDLSRTPGGSSSGSAVALACGLAAGALGTQTGGSLCRPASYCGVCALKPTFGTWPSQGILPLSGDLDHPGPMARFLEDLIPIHETITGQPHHPIAAEGRTLRLGLPQGLFVTEVGAEIREFVLRSQASLEKAGIELTEVELPGDFSDLPDFIGVLMAFGAWQTHQLRFGQNPTLYPARIRELLEKGAALPPGQVDQARARAISLRQNLIQRMRGQDAWLIPGFHDFPPDPSSTGVPRFHAPWSFLGWPEVAFGVELSRLGLPLALQLVGRPHADGALLAQALKVQKILGHPPLPAR